MGYKDKFLNGEVPESGAIFMANIRTKKECLRLKLFGLPSGMSDFVLHVKKGMTLFLFEFERRLLYGVFRATSDGEINIEPKAFRSSGKHFPAQVRFTSVWDCSPLAEHEFQDAIRDNYFSGKKFKFGLNKDQVSKLMKLFRSKKLSNSHSERNVLRYGDKPAEGDSRFGDLRKDMRDRLRFVSEEDGHDPDICEFGGDESKEVDDQFYSTKNSEEVRPKDNRDGFLTNYMAQNGDFGVCVTRQDALGKPHDHSFGGLRGEADAGLSFTSDANDGHEMHGRFEEIRGLTNEDSFFMMENRKGEHDIDDGYIPLFTEPLGKRYGEINNANVLMDGKNKDDYTRMHDEYNVREVFRPSFSERHLGSNCGIEGQTINDKYFCSHEAVENELRNEHSSPIYDEDRIFWPTTLTEHPMCTPKGTTFGMKADNDKYFGFESSSHLSQNTYSLSCDSTRKEVPDSRLTPSYFVGGSSFIPLDDGPLYPSSNEISTLLPMSQSTPSHSHNEGSTRYFEDPDYSSLSKSQLTVEGKPLYNTTFLEGSKISSYPDFIFKRLPSSDAGLCVREEDPVDNDKRLCRPRSSNAGSCVREEDPIDSHKRFCQPRDSKHSFGTDKRVSVFARLNSALRHKEQEFETDKKHELDASVNKVMKMLEKVVSGPIKRIEKSKAAFKQDDGDEASNYNSIDHELPEVKRELDADLADEETEDGSVLPETRILDFKRRKKARKCIDDTSKENSECLVGAASDVGPVEMGVSCKRRKLVRPAFVEKKSTAGGVCGTMDTYMLQNSPSNDDSTSTKEELESSEKVDASIRFVDINMLPDSHKLTPSEDDKRSTEAVVESSQKVVASIRIMDDVFRVPTFDEKIPCKDNCLTEVVLGCSEKVDAECQKSLEEREKCSQVEGDGNVEDKHSKEGNNSTKAVDEISEKADAFIKSVQLPAKCQKSAHEREESSQVEDGNAENCQLSDVFVEVTKVPSSKEDQKMCGWIEW